MQRSIAPSRSANLSLAALPAIPSNISAFALWLDKISFLTVHTLVLAELGQKRSRASGCWRPR